MFKRLLIFLLVIVTTATASIPVALAGKELAKEQVLYFASPGRDIRAIDPAFCLLSAELFITYPMFNALVRYPPGNEGDLEAIEPDLAERWDVSKDGKTWTFFIRKGIKFHKEFGELTAEDVKFSIDRLKTESSPWAKVFNGIKEIKIIDNYTVQFILKVPDPYFLMKLTNYHGGLIVSKKAREQLGKKFKTEPIGTGPFQFMQYRPKDRYVLKRHDAYWRGKPILEKIIVPFMPDLASTSMALETGEIHLAQGKRDEMWVKTMKKKKDFLIDSSFQLGVSSWVHMNMTRKPFDDIKVRKALAYATNRDGFVEYFGSSITKPLYGHVPEYAFGALKGDDIPKDLRYDYNLEKAKQLLRKAGYPNGLSFKMLISEKRTYMLPTTLLQEQWRRVGIKVELETVDHATYQSRVRKDVNPIVWYNATRPPIAGIFLEQWYHSDSIVGKKTAISNFTHYGEVDADGDGQVNDNNIDELINKSWIEMDPEKRKKLYAEAQIRLLKDLPTIPVYIIQSVLVRQPYIDLGYEPKKAMIYLYHITEKTRILKH